MLAAEAASATAGEEPPERQKASEPAAGPGEPGGGEVPGWLADLATAPATPELRSSGLEALAEDGRQPWKWTDEETGLLMLRPDSGATDVHWETVEDSLSDDDVPGDVAGAGEALEAATGAADAGSEAAGAAEPVEGGEGEVEEAAAEETAEEAAQAAAEAVAGAAAAWQLALRGGAAATGARAARRLRRFRRAPRGDARRPAGRPIEELEVQGSRGAVRRRHMALAAGARQPPPQEEVEAAAAGGELWAPGEEPEERRPPGERGAAAAPLATWALDAAGPAAPALPRTSARPLTGSSLGATTAATLAAKAWVELGRARAPRGLPELVAVAAVPQAPGTPSALHTWRSSTPVAAPTPSRGAAGRAVRPASGWSGSGSGSGRGHFREVAAAEEDPGLPGLGGLRLPGGLPAGLAAGSAAGAATPGASLPGASSPAASLWPEAPAGGCLAGGQIRGPAGGFEELEPRWRPSRPQSGNPRLMFPRGKWRA